MNFSPFNIGYGGAGGSIDSQSLSGFNSYSGSAISDITPFRWILVSRARQLAISSPMASAVIDRFVGGIIGNGLSYAYPDHSEFIDAPYRYENIAKLIKKRFSIASYMHLLDAQKRQTFYQMQELACRNWLLSGDIFFVRKESDDISSWRAIESDRCMTPYYMATKDQYNAYICFNPDTGNRIIDGVELDKDSIPVAYWISRDFIQQPLDITNEQIERIPAKDEYENPLVIHVFKQIRPDQYRGIPILADIIEALHTTKNYIQAEVQAAQFQSAIWGFLTCENPTFDETDALFSRDLDEKIPLEPKTDQTPPDTPTMQLSADFAQEADQRALYDTLYPRPKTVSAGQLWHLKDGEDVKFLQSTHPNNNYDSFIRRQNLMVASAVGIPSQVLECSYEGTYASARGSVLEANRTFKTYRSYFIETFIKPLFEQFVYDNLTSFGMDRSDAEFISKSMSIESIWQAPTALCLDPTKEIDAWKRAIELGLVDRDEAAMALYGHKATGKTEADEKIEVKEEIAP